MIAGGAGVSGATTRPPETVAGQPEARPLEAVPE